MVKAIVFRSLRILFARDSRFFHESGLGRFYPLIHELLDRVEDVYDSSLPHLDAFLLELEDAFGDHPILGVIAETLDSFRVCYVLNMFNGVEESYEAALVPFVRNLSEHVSARLQLTQLGWIVFDENVQRANAIGHPILLGPPEDVAGPAAIDPVMAELERIEESVLGLDRPRRKRSRTRRELPFDLAGANDVLAAELRTLHAMYDRRSRDMVRENFAYVTYRALNLMAPHRASSEFGQTALRSPEQLLDWFLRWQIAHQGRGVKRPPSEPVAPRAADTPRGVPGSDGPSLPQ